LDPGAFQNFFVDVNGTISDGGYTVWVNGVRADPGTGGAWTAQHVPVNQGGTATIHATAIPNSDNGGYGTLPQANALDNVNSPNRLSTAGIAATVDEDTLSFIRIAQYTKIYHFEQHYTVGDICT